MGPNPVLKENQEKPETKWIKGSCEPRARFPTGAIPICGKEFRKNLNRKLVKMYLDQGAMFQAQQAEEQQPQPCGSSALQMYTMA